MLPLQHVNAGQHTVGARCLAGGCRSLHASEPPGRNKGRTTMKGSESDHFLPIGHACKLNRKSGAPGFPATRPSPTSTFAAFR